MTQSLANKYRPQKFSDVVGQESAIKILKNQIDSGEIKHGYLFTGSAGTGKTTIARIFAREINRPKGGKIQDLNDFENQMFNESLNERSVDGVLRDEAFAGAEYEVLESIFGADDLDDKCIKVLPLTGPDWEVSTYAVFYKGDVESGPSGEIIEIDAASNNGVDHVRELRENCKFRPINGGYKVYVIDECHMLSTGAWNALLKTLEEPPEHCVFILCTTDPQKIPATILSRVQRFQFKRMTTEQIFDRLEHIIVSENRLAARVAVEYIAKLANGGMRDAISILDTCLGYLSDNEDLLDVDMVSEIMSTADYQLYIDLCNYKLDKDLEHVLLIIEEVHNSGKDLRQFVKGFISFILDVEKYQILGNMEHISAPSMYEDAISKLGREELFGKWFGTLNKLNEAIKYDPNPKVTIEAVFMII